MKLEFEDAEDLQKFLNENLLPKKEAAEITGQSINAFSQSIKLGYVKPFYESSSGKTSSRVRLYLKSELEEYRDSKRK